MYTDSLKHKPMTDSPWLAIYDNHGFDPCNTQHWPKIGDFQAEAGVQAQERCIFFFFLDNAI